MIYHQHRERGELVAHLNRQRVGVCRVDGGEQYRGGGRQQSVASAVAVRPHKLGSGGRKSAAAQPTPTPATTSAAAAAAARELQHLCRSGAWMWTKMVA